MPRLLDNITEARRLTTRGARYPDYAPLRPSNCASFRSVTRSSYNLLKINIVLGWSTSNPSARRLTPNFDLEQTQSTCAEQNPNIRRLRTPQHAKQTP